MISRDFQESFGVDSFSKISKSAKTSNGRFNYTLMTLWHLHIKIMNFDFWPNQLISWSLEKVDWIQITLHFNSWWNLIKKIFFDQWSSTSNLLYVSRKTAQKERCYFCFDQFFVFYHHNWNQRGIKKCFASSKKETTNDCPKIYFFGCWKLLSFWIYCLHHCLQFILKQDSSGTCEM